MAIIICPNCGNEISDEMEFCPHCKTPMSVILSQKPKKKRTTPVLVPVLSVLDGLVLLGTVGLLTWGVMNPAVISPTAMESAVTSTDPGTACSIISTLQGNAAKNYNKYHHDVPSAQSEPLTPITEVSQDVGTVEPEAGQVTPLSGESAESPEQNSTPQQEAQAPQQPGESTQTASPNPVSSQIPAPTPDAEETTPQTPKPTTGNNGSYTHDFSGGRVLITTASDNNNDPVYHIRDCTSARRISPSNEAWYDSADAAEAAGRRLCGNCSR